MAKYINVMNEFRIEGNSWCNKQITIPTNDFARGIFYAREKNCDGIYIISSFPDHDELYDLNLLQDVSDVIVHLSFGEFLPIRISNHVEGIYSLNRLKSLFLPQRYENVNLERLKSIEVLSVNSINLKNIGSLDNLLLFQVRGKLGKNLVLLSELKSLPKLLLINTDIENLDGIDDIGGLKHLELSYNKKLIDISKVNNTRIEELKILKCKNIRELSILKGNESIINLYIDEINSLDFISELKHIKTLGFQNVKDGNMNNILNSHSLEKVRFYPDRKHYSHKEIEINDFLSSAHQQ
jgi:internalin A